MGQFFGRTSRKHLRPYSIYGRRKTTINHAFASALAPCDCLDEQWVVEAMRLLGQDPRGELTCVYCGDPAETWDHLVGLVKNSQLRGYGHQLGNLVPCCKDCNSRKGSKGWRAFLRQEMPDSAERDALEERLTLHLQTYAREIDLTLLQQRYSAKLDEYRSIKKRVFRLMEEADRIADELRDATTDAKT